ncbi:MAG: hypothetical protein HFE65_11130 [Clostridiales bacterium]|nr:hypothetical protein [Clostridiales bacterium]
MKKRFIKFINVSFLLICLSFLFVGLIKTVFFPKDINHYENRYAKKIGTISANSVLNSTFQEDCEAALSDQILLSQSMKKLYNDVTAQYKDHMMRLLIEADMNCYINLGSKLLFNGNLCFPTVPLKQYQPDLDKKLENFNQYFSIHPETEFYIYYIEKDTDINFETQEVIPISDYIFEHAALPKSHMAAFEINSFADFQDRFYKTDHHWNYKGSYQAYQEVLKLLGCDEPPLTPINTVEITDSFVGSKAAGMDSIFQETFSAYAFSFPSMTVFLNGKSADDYGNMTAFLDRSRQDVSYGEFYGDDAGEIILDTGHVEKENILLIGESYDNAILKLLASHFNHTHSVDLRNYRALLGKDFQLSSYLEENHITKVLLIGNVDYFVMDEFRLGD